MTSRLNLTERIKSSLTKPQEILTWSNDKNGNIEYNDSALRFYYPPTNAELERQPIDLCAGFKAANFNPDSKKTVDLDAVLKGMIRVEQQTGERVDASIITWRGVWTRLIALSQPYVDQYALKEPLEFQVVEFDGQIFICYTESLASDDRSENMLRPMYCGYQFEHVATLKKPWGECTREEIESRYDVSQFDPLSDLLEYVMLIKAKIGNVPLLYAAETDCVEGFKPTSGDVHKNYVELKTAGMVYNPQAAQNFERKLYKVWIQSFLSRVPKVVFGFRDQNMNLNAIEEFETNSIPNVIKNSKVTPRHRQWSAKHTLDFFGVLAQFLVDCVKPGKSYMLTLDPHKMQLVLTPKDINIGRKVAFLSDEFVDWRLSLAKKPDYTKSDV